MRWCLWPFGFAWGSSVPDPKGLGLGGGVASDMVTSGDEDSAGDCVGAAVGSQWCPGFTMRLTVSPSLMVYSLRSFESARAFPLSKRRWTSAGGADGNAASCDFISATVSVGSTRNVKDAEGLRLLNVRDMEAAIKTASMNVTKYDILSRGVTYQRMILMVLAAACVVGEEERQSVLIYSRNSQHSRHHGSRKKYSGRRCMNRGDKEVF